MIHSENRNLGNYENHKNVVTGSHGCQFFRQKLKFRQPVGINFDLILVVRVFFYILALKSPRVSRNIIGDWFFQKIENLGNYENYKNVVTGSHGCQFFAKNWSSDNL